jgi:hypothetical protein
MHKKSSTSLMATLAKNFLKLFNSILLGEWNYTVFLTIYIKSFKIFVPLTQEVPNNPREIITHVHIQGYLLQIFIIPIIREGRMC